MTLSPEEIRQIAEAIAASYGPYAIGGLIFGLVSAVICGIAIALKITVPFGARMVEEKMLDPEGAVQKARAVELGNFKAEVAASMADKIKAEREKIAADYDQQRQRVEAKLEEMRLSVVGIKMPELPNFDVMAEDFAKLAATVDGIKAQFTDERILALMKKAYTDSEMAARARGGKVERTTELEEVVALGGQAIEHPEAAAAYQGLLQVINIAETLVEDNPKNAAKIAKARRQAEDLYARGGDLIAARDAFIEAYPAAGARLGASGGVARGGKSGPAQF